MKRAIIAHHPLGDTPYNKLFYVGANVHGTPLYEVLGVDGPPASAPTALRRAFNRYGGHCFYCRTRLKPQARPTLLSLDHVVPLARGGTHLLHNFVLACKPCNREKDCQSIAAFRPEAGQLYGDALERHIADAVRSASSV